MTATRCACGCGQFPNPGNRFVKNHHVRLRRKEPQEKHVQQGGRCPACGGYTMFRADGTPGRHWTTRSRNREKRMRCPAGEKRTVVLRKGRRACVSIDVVIPHGWTVRQFKTAAMDVLRREIADAFVINVDVEEVS